VGGLCGRAWGAGHRPAPQPVRPMVLQGIGGALEGCARPERGWGSRRRQGPQRLPQRLGLRGHGRDLACVGGRCVGGEALVAVRAAGLPQALDQTRQRGRRGRDGLGGAEARVQPPQAGPQGTRRVVETAGGETPGDGDAMRPGAPPPRPHLAARDRVLGTPPAPTPAVLPPRPPGHGRTNGREDPQGGVCGAPLAGRQVDAGQARARGAGRAPGGVALRGSAGLGGQGRARTCLAQGLPRRGDRLSALGHLRVGDGIQLDGLASGQPGLGAPKARQGVGHGVRSVLALGVAPRGQRHRRALAREEGLQAGQAGHARAVTDHGGALAGPLRHGLVPVLQRVGGRGEEPVAVTQGAAPHAPLVRRPQGASAQPRGRQAMQPLAVEPIGVRATGGPLGVPGLDAEDRHAAGRQQREPGHPGDPRSRPSRRESRHRQGASRRGRRGRRCTCRNGVRVGGRTPGAQRPTARLHPCRCPRRGGGRPGGLPSARLAAGAAGPGDEGQAQSLGGVSSSLRQEDTASRTAVGAGVTDLCAVSHTGSGQGLSPVRWSPTPETPLTNGHTAPMRGRSRRPTVSKAGEHRAPGAAPVPSTCVAAQSPKPLTMACKRRLPASARASLPLPAAPDAQR